MSIDKTTTLQKTMAPVDESQKVDKRGAHLKKADHEKVPKKEYVPTGNPRGRKKGQKNKKDNRGAHLRKENRNNPDFVTVNGKKTV